MSKRRVLTHQAIHPATFPALGVVGMFHTAPHSDTPQTITLIRQQNQPTLRDVLATVPGITFGAGEGGGGYGDSINLRG